MAVEEERGYAWLVMVAAFFSHVLCGGITYCIGSFFIVFTNNVVGGQHLLTVVTSLNMALYNGGCFPSGLLVDRYGTRVVGLTGAALMSLGLILSTFATYAYHLLVTFGIITGLGIAGVYHSAIVTMSQHFNQYRNFAMSFISIGMSIGSLIFPLIISQLAETYGWRGAMLMVGGIGMHGLLFAATYIPKEKIIVRKEAINAEFEVQTFEDDDINGHLQKNGNAKNGGYVSCQAAPDTNDFKCNQISSNGSQIYDRSEPNGNDIKFERSENEASYGYTKERNTHPDSGDGPMLNNCPGSSGWGRLHLHMFRNTTYSLLLLHDALFNMVASALYIHLGAFAIDQGFTEKAANFLFVYMGVGNAFFRFPFSFVAQRFKTHIALIYMLSFLVGGTLVCLLPFLQGSYALLGCASFLIGGLVSTYGCLTGPLLAGIFDIAHFAMAYGYVGLVAAVGSIAGGPLASWLQALSGSYATVFLTAGTIIYFSAFLIKFPRVKLKLCPYL